MNGLEFYCLYIHLATISDLQGLYLGLCHEQISLFNDFISFSFFQKIAFSDAGVNHKLWVYEKVSGVDVFGKYDLNTIKNLDEIYNKVAFAFRDKTLTIMVFLKVTMCVQLAMSK